ncbi:MAG: PorT family protein [Bacteroidales bacterium]|nr:PorT family protein [Bacteroidales bacterium]
MKKFFAIFLLLGALVPINAQKKVKFGVIVEPKISWLLPESKKASPEGVFWGFGGGLEIDRYFAKNYAFSTGLSLGSQGGKLSYADTIVITTQDDEVLVPKGTTIEYNLQYLTIPVGLKLRSNQIGYSTFFANLGLTGQINMKSKASSNNTNGLAGDVMKDEINLFNLGYHFGGGIEYSLGEDTALLAGIMYQNGFVDVTQLKPKTPSRVVSLRIGIMF